LMMHLTEKVIMVWQITESYLFASMMITSSKTLMQIQQQNHLPLEKMTTLISMSINPMNQNDQLKYEKFGMTHNQLQELRSFLVERMVDNMSTQDLVEYVTDDLDKYFDDLPDAEFIDEAKNYWDDSYDDVVEDIKDYTDCDFKKPLREPFEETN